MPIVINDFEVVVEPPPSRQPTPAAQESRPVQAQPLRPTEIVTVMEVHEERLRRVRAD